MMALPKNRKTHSDKPEPHERPTSEAPAKPEHQPGTEDKPEQQPSPDTAKPPETEKPPDTAKPPDNEEASASDTPPVNIPPDSLQAVDCANQKINIGDAVYFVGIVKGFRADIDNRLNILIMPMYNVITNNDPSNPFIGAVDAKLLPMSGYHCVNTGPISNVADVFTPITDPLLTQLRELAQKAADTVPTPLPSNFLVPSYA